ncbi:phage holin family protein [Fructilactobacillus florum]|uniref:phage holin family protein n=1 Tax=Fructilactobacillus florum TaxID=640331 RepID=UPI00028DF72E|nr:phage holin family protein [Fructilactobacillus florum]EKK20536.1 membrane protein [Fructilactobacillus florum 2F]
MWFFGRILLNFLLFMAFSGVFPEAFFVRNWQTALLAAVVLVIFNLLVRPLCLLLFLPLNLLTVGLFTFVINAGMLWLTSFALGDKFQFSSLTALVGISLLMSLCTTLFTKGSWQN